MDIYFIGGYINVKHTVLIHKTSLREEHCVSLSPDSEFLSRWGLGAALWLEEVLRDLFLSCIYIVRNKCLYRLNAYFRKFQRILVKDMHEQNPPVLPLSLSPALSLTVPNFFKCFKCDIKSTCSFGTSQNPKWAGTKGLPRAGRPGGSGGRHIY